MIIISFSKASSDKAFKLGVYFDELTVNSVVPGYPATDYLIPGDTLMGISRLKAEENDNYKEFIGKTLQTTEKVPEIYQITTNHQLVEVLKEIQPEDTVLLWIRRGNLFRKVYIPATYEIPKDPLIFPDYPNHTSAITKIDILERENLLVTASADKTVKAFDLQTGDTIKTLYPPFRTGKDGQVVSCTISPETKDIACSLWLDVHKEDVVFHVFEYESGAIKKR